MIRSDVEPRKKVFTPVSCMMKVGATAMKARKSAETRVIRERTRSRYSAVGRPGRMPGMKPPYFFMLSATSWMLKEMAE